MRYTKTFKFADTEQEAKTFCSKENASGTRYKRTHHKAYYTPWSSKDGQAHKFVVWYYV